MAGTVEILSGDDQEEPFDPLTEVRLLRSVVNSLIGSVEGSGYVVLSHGGRALRFRPDKTEAIQRARNDPEAWA